MLKRICTLALILNVITILLVKCYKIDLTILSIAALAQIYILLKHKSKNDSYKTTIDICHWIFFLSIPMCIFYSKSNLTLLYAASIVLITLYVRYNNKKCNKEPCPFEQEAKDMSTVPNYSYSQINFIFIIFLILILYKLNKS